MCVLGCSSGNIDVVGDIPRFICGQEFVGLLSLYDRFMLTFLCLIGYSFQNSIYNVEIMILTDVFIKCSQWGSDNYTINSENFGK